MLSCVLCRIFIQTTEFDIPCSHSSEEISSAVNEPSQDFNNAQRRLLSLSQLDKNLLMHYDHKANILKAVKKEKAVVWTFSVHCETLRSIVDSSTDYWGGQETTAQ